MWEELIKLAAGGIEKILEDIYGAASDELRERTKQQITLRNLELIISNIAEIGRVKTINDPDEIVDLRDIFFEKAIAFPKLGSIDRFGLFGQRKVLIEGGPGQGKSLFMKYLCLNEADCGQVVPIFIEFRNLSFKSSLKSELMESIRAFDVDVDDELFGFLAKSQRLLFILDGFDEIQSEARRQVARELELIARTYPDLKIIISSRPEAGLGASVYFHKFRINELDKVIQKKL